MNIFKASVIAFIIFSANLNSQQHNFCSELSKIEKIVKQNHIKPKTVNDSLSKAVFYLFINGLDSDKRFFRQEDIEVFKKDEFLIDDFIKNKNCSFIKKYRDIFEERISETKSIIENLKNVTLDYSGKDSLRYSDKSEHKFFKSIESAKKYWSKKIRLSVLQNIVDRDTLIENSIKNFSKLEKEEKLKAINKHICILSELESSYSSLDLLVKQTFFNAFLHYQDPNSLYFSNSEKNTFENSLSNTQDSFGIITSKQDNGNITIAHIIPGSSAFKSEKLDTNDIILSLTNRHETLEVSCISNQTVNSFLNNNKYKSIIFKVKKRSGKIIDVQLKKTELEVEENKITGYLLKGKYTIGYIKIPSFYTDFETTNGLGVANDVSKEFYKLQKHSLNGLIIDLRFNGGGSMKEAAELSGMFIDRGPLAITKVRHQENFTIRDPNRGKLSSLPILILVDQFSASASEFFTSAMQDYKRAIIVGSVTHGKGTSQIIIPVSKSNNKSFVKLTTGQFYRVTGKSHQKIGITPDIILPNVYDNYNSQENYMPYSIENDTVNVSLKHKVGKSLDLKKLKELSKNRINNNNTFKVISKFNDFFINKLVYKTGTFPLNLDFVYNESKNYTAMWENYDEKLNAFKVSFEVQNTNSTNTILEFNEVDKSINENYRIEIESDPYIEEGYLILQDLINLN